MPLPVPAPFLLLLFDEVEIQTRLHAHTPPTKNENPEEEAMVLFIYHTVVFVVTRTPLLPLRSSLAVGWTFVLLAKFKNSTGGSRRFR